MQRMVVKKFQRQREIANKHPERRGLASNRHLDCECRAGGVDAAAHTAGATGDEDRIPRVATDHDDLIAAEKSRDGPRLDHLPVLEISDGMESEGPRDTSDRIEVHRFDVPVSANELLDLFRRQLPRAALGNRGTGAIRVADSFAQERLALRVELNRKVFKAHDVSPGS